MYEEHFGLTSRPFGAQAEGAGVFVGPQQAKIMNSLTKGLGASDAVVTVTGPVGVGKTTIVSRALESISPGRMVAWVGRMQLAPDEVLELLLTGFGVSREAKGTIQRFAAFRRLLAERAAAGAQVAIVVEDAQRIGADALIELEALTAADAGDATSANIILMGQPALNKMLATPELARMRQRNRLRQTIEAYSEAEVSGYLKHCIREAGGDYDAIFDSGVASVVYKCSEGVPRIINTLCETALTAAMDNGQPRVSVSLMKQVAGDAFGYEATQTNAIPTIEADAFLTPEPVEEVSQSDVDPKPAPAAADNSEETAPDLIDDTHPELEQMEAAPDDSDEAFASLDIEATQTQKTISSPVINDVNDDELDEDPDADFSLDAALSVEAEETNVMPGITPNLDQLAADAKQAEAAATATASVATENIPTLSNSMRIDVEAEVQRANESEPQNVPQPAVAAVPAKAENKAPAAEPIAAIEPEPVPATAPDSIVAAKPEPDSEPEVLVKPEPLPKPEPVSEAVVKPEPRPEPQPAPQTVAKPEPKPEPQQKPEPVVTPEPKPEPQPELQAVAKPEPLPEPQPKPQALVKPEAIPEPQPAPQAVAKPEPLPEPQAEPEAVTESKDTGGPVTDASVADDAANLAEQAADAWSHFEDDASDESESVEEISGDNEALALAMEDLSVDEGPQAASPKATTTTQTEIGKKSDKRVPDIDALEAALSAAKKGDFAAQPDTPVATPDTNDEVSKEPEKNAADPVSNVPEITLDDSLPKEDADDSAMRKVAQQIGDANSLEDVSDIMAETIFGSQALDEIAAAVVANPPQEETVSPVMLAESDVAAANDANETNPVASAVPAVKPGKPDESAAKRLDMVKALNNENEKASAPAGEEIEMSSGNPNGKPVVSKNNGPQPEPIENQINTSMTQTLKALNAAQIKKAQEPEEEKKSGGLFSRFRKSS